MKKLDDKKEKEDLVLMNVEKELWESGDWRENIKGRRGKFLGAPRTTFTESVMKYEKNKPAPNAFDNKEKLKKMEKIEGNYLL